MTYWGGHKSVIYHLIAVLGAVGIWYLFEVNCQGFPRATAIGLYVMCHVFAFSLNSKSMEYNDDRPKDEPVREIGLNGYFGMVMVLLILGIMLGEHVINIYYPDFFLADTPTWLSNNCKGVR